MATLVKFAKADHHFDDKEKQLINDVVTVFKKGEDQRSLFQKIINKIRIKKISHET